MTSSAGLSRIPTPRASVERTPSSASACSAGGGSGSRIMTSSVSEHGGGGGEVQRLRSVIRRLQNTLNVVLDADATVRNNLHSLRQDVEEAMAQTDSLCAGGDNFAV